MSSILDPIDPTPRSRVFVRLRRSWFRTAAGVAMKTEMNILKRRSTNWEWIEEDIGGAGADVFIGRITNWGAMPDGIYELTITNPCRDFETGIVEDWDYELVPLPVPFAPFT